ncbi:hypothetical protein JCM19241_5960 [Vibrio ishigakensis]|uniref:ParB-like N-terminal domain-containing protein n=1 Tax=Vibrio ishigakensis TaxID=1481914 RepID=A0A0B8QS43_9VIBR|nr:hypothetical protein JCM19241_5960 [Vibrio ishigakensis]
MAKKTDFSKVDIKTIKEGERFRKDYDQVGINDLAKSIDTSGLLQPLGVDERGVLIWGGRRFRAIELLIKKAIHSGDTERAEWLSMVPAIIVDLSAMASEHNGTAGRLNEIDQKRPET